MLKPSEIVDIHIETLETYLKLWQESKEREGIESFHRGMISGLEEGIKHMKTMKSQIEKKEKGETLYEKV